MGKTLDGPLLFHGDCCHGPSQSGRTWIGAFIGARKYRGGCAKWFSLRSSVSSRARAQGWCYRYRQYGECYFPLCCGAQYGSSIHDRPRARCRECMLFGFMPIRHANDENNVLDLARAKDIWSPSIPPTADARHTTRHRDHRQVGR